MAQSSTGTRGRKPAAHRLSREGRDISPFRAPRCNRGNLNGARLFYRDARRNGVRGFVTVKVETVCAGDRTIKVRSFRITDLGRKVVATNADHVRSRSSFLPNRSKPHDKAAKREQNPDYTRYTGLLVVLCFSKSEDAEAFAFGRERLGLATIPENKRDDTKGRLLIATE
jgi:hypothetical protein